MNKSDIPKMDVQQLKTCICLRKPTKILCSVCKLMQFGRVETQCPLPEHQKVKYLMDIRFCHFCKASARYLREVSINDYRERLNGKKM